MSTTPVLSYKKPSLARTSTGSRTPSQPNSPLLSSPRIPSQGSSSGTGRKVLSRRKALQDFYNIERQKQAENESNNQDNDGTGLGINVGDEPLKTDAQTPTILKRKQQNIDLKDPELLNKFIKENSIQDILRLRNSITNDLNSHDSAKKSIIYDNYYELIKLNQVLGDLSKSKPSDTNTSLAPSSNHDLQNLELYKKDKNNSHSITDAYIDTVFNDLSNFINEEADGFSDDFESVARRFQDDYTSSDSNASVKGIMESEDEIEPGIKANSKFPESIDKINLVNEISVLLGNDKTLLDSTKKTYKDSIQNILRNLDGHKDGLLILQLNEIKKKFQ